MDIGGLFNTVVSEVSKIIPKKEKVEEVAVSNARTAIKEFTPMALTGSNFVRLAGLSGGIAVAMSAYGAHGTYAFFSKS